MDLQKQTLVFSDYRNDISVDLVQHEAVRVVLEESSQDGLISAELSSPDCTSGTLCPRLSHHVLHTGDRTFLTIFVEQDGGHSHLLFGFAILISAVLLFLAALAYRRWAKLKGERSLPNKDDDETVNTELIDEIYEPSSSLMDEHTGITISAHEKMKENGFYSNSQKLDDMKRPSHSSSKSSGWPWWFLCMTFTFLLCLGLLVVALGQLNETKGSPDATLKLNIPKRTHIRHIRSYSEDPSLKDIQMGQGGHSPFITRLQVLDLSPDCRGNLSTCRVHALCDSSNPEGKVVCRCNIGYYLKDMTCLPCSTSCDDGFYMTSQCTAEQDVVCKPCTQCEGTSYEVATCTSTQDTLCIDVTFPIKQFLSKTSPEVLASLNASMSENVFLERLRKFRTLETAIPVSNNKQEMEFVWERGTGLEIKVKVSEIYLIPEYVEVEKVDDVGYVKESNYPTDVVNQLTYVHDHHCKRPIPDEYDLIMYISNNIANEAYETICEPELRRCPKGVKPGKKYVRKRLRRCKKVKDQTGRIFLTKRENAIFCSGNSVLANQIFGKLLKDQEDLKFPSNECKGYKKECDECLRRQACYGGGNESDCCNRGCHLRSACKNLFSPTCPELPVECVQEDLAKFTIMPRYPSISRQFSCHLKHEPPEYLYVVSYVASVPSLQFTFEERIKKVFYKNLSDHQDGQEQADYLFMTHKTESRYSDEVILFGVFNISSKKDVSHYTLHRLKESWELDHTTPFDIRPTDDSTLKTDIQFERPFLYSTSTWDHDGCDKNVSQIITPQLIYHSFGLPLEPPDLTKNKRNEFVYQLYSKDSSPTIRFSTLENTSIMSYYKDMFKGSTIMAGTLKGNIVWDRQKQRWQISVTGFITECPGYFRVEILSQSNSRLALYDMLVVCPRNFSLSFSIKHEGQYSDVFLVVFNDTVTSYKIILTSMQTPQYLSKDSNNIITMERSHGFPTWLPIIAIIIVSFVVSVFLLILYVYCDKKKSKHIPIDINLPKPDLGTQITLLQGMDRPEKREGVTLQTKFICSTLVILYLAYAILFTFSALFGMLHIIQGSSFSEITYLSNTSAKIQNQMQTRLQMMVNYENQESERMLRAAEQRLKACSKHLKSSLRDRLPDLNEEMEKYITKLFGDAGINHEMLRRYFAKKQESYFGEIKKFVDEFNQTIDRALTNRLLVEYTQYLENVADSRWLKFPRELYIDQQRRNGKYLSDVRENLLEFLTWLEIEKVKDVLEIKHLLMERLLNRMPVVDFADFLDNSDSPNIGTVNLTYRGSKTWLKFTTGLPPGYHSYSFTNRHSKYFHLRNQSKGDGGDFLSSMRAMLYPLFICAFLVLDIFLLSYRISWMMKCIHKFKVGIEQRVPYNSITRTIHFILTGISVPRTEDSLDHPYDYYMNIKDNIWGENTELYFLYCQSSAKEKEEILKDLYASKQQKNPEDIKPKRLTWYSCCITMLKFAYRVCIAPVFWRCVLICGFVLFLCLITKATDDLVTMESASFLMDTESVAPILTRQNAMTNTVLQQYGDYLNDFLNKYKTALDAEVNSLNLMLVHVAERQSILLNKLISDMCSLAGHTECDNNFNLVTTSLTSCNFLPIKPKLYTGYHENILSEFIIAELSPVVTNFRSILLSTWYLLLGFAAAMLICQITARVIFVQLKKSPHLRTTKIYQLPSTFEWQDQQSFPEKEMYASQSVIAESCESGVYDMTS